MDNAKVDDIKLLWNMMDDSDLSIVIMDIRDEHDKPFKALALLKGEETIKAFKELQNRMAKSGSKPT